MRRRLNKESFKKAVNVDSFNKIQLDSNSKLLPIGDISEIINVADQFNKERQNSSYYRITGNIVPLFTNVLFNTTGNSSWQTFNSDKFRDGTFPADGVGINSDEDLTFNESVAKYLRENNSWYGYQDPDRTKDSICTWVDMEPNRKLFSFSPQNNIKNWELTVTYPANSSALPTDNLIYQGLLVISSEVTIIGGRNMVTFSTPIKHGLSQGDTVKLKGFNNPDIENGAYKVIRVGKSNGDEMEYYFSVDIEDVMLVTANSRMVRIYNGEPSSYYYRTFEKIKMKESEFMEDDDYETFPLAFAQTIFEDKVNQFVINEDIDVSGLKDNLGRPLSEIYITFIKTSGDDDFTNLKAGIEMPYNFNADSDVSIPDIRRITNSEISNRPLEFNGITDIDITNDKFYGDIAEYNRLEVKEKILGEVYHRFNTPNREGGGNIAAPNFIVGENIDLEVRHEGYIYKAHHRIPIREYSTYIEQGTSQTLNLPTYSHNLGDGRYIWRDLLDIGFNDMNEIFLDYPFLNGSHYLDTCISFPLKRQDPFNLYRLQHTNPPADIPGILMDDKLIVKTAQDVC